MIMRLGALRIHLQSKPPCPFFLLMAHLAAGTGVKHPAGRDRCDADAAAARRPPDILRPTPYQ